MDSLEARMERYQAQIEKRFDSLEAKMERNYVDGMGALHRLENYNLLAERLARVESKLQNVA
jgi:hypothetical protein